MDNNVRHAQAQAQGQVQIPGQVMGGEAVAAQGVETGDWRTQLQADSRERIVMKIMDTLKRHLPLSGEEGLQEIKRIAVRYEEKIYTAATSQSDYLRKISLKMLTMETKSFQSNASSISKNPQDTVSSETKMATSISSLKRRSEHEIDTTRTIDVELIPKIHRLAERSKNAVSKNQLEEIVRDLDLLRCTSELVDANEHILHASEVITQRLSDYEDPKIMKMMLKDDAEVLLAMKMQTWICLVNLCCGLL